MAERSQLSEAAALAGGTLVRFGFIPAILQEACPRQTPSLSSSIQCLVFKLLAKHAPRKTSLGKCEGVREVVFVFPISSLIKGKYWKRQEIRNIAEFLR